MLRASFECRYKVSGRACLHKELDQVFIELKAKISSHLQSVKLTSAHTAATIRECVDETLAEGDIVLSKISLF